LTLRPVRHKTLSLRKGSMPPPDVNGPPKESEDRFAVGWQRLTRQEFLEAISAALLDRVQKHDLENAEKPESYPSLQLPAELTD
jgi:hypothetical protein